MHLNNTAWEQEHHPEWDKSWWITCLPPTRTECMNTPARAASTEQGYQWITEDRFRRSLFWQASKPGLKVKQKTEKILSVETGCNVNAINSDYLIDFTVFNSPDLQTSFNHMVLYCNKCSLSLQPLFSCEHTCKTFYCCFCQCLLSEPPHSVGTHLSE